MKRSEMIKIIWNAGNHLSMEYPDDDDMMNLIAGDILNAIEKAGMLPPSTHLKIFDVTDNMWESEKDD